MITNSVYSPEGRVKRASGVTLAFIFGISVFLGLGVMYACSNYLYSNLTPYQKLYYSQYRASFFSRANSFKKENSYKLLTYTLTDPKTKKQSEYLWNEREMYYEPDRNGNLKIKPDGFPDFLARKDSRAMQGVTYFQPRSRENAEVYRLLKEAVFDKSEYYEFLYLPAGIGFASFIAFLFVGDSMHRGSIRRKLEGIFKRGMYEFTVKEYDKVSRKADGFRILVNDPDASKKWGSRIWKFLKGLVSPDANTYKLRISRKDESKGVLILGDTGTGKSVLLHQIIGCARSDERQEPGVCYDPASEFVQYHYQDDRDYILNPFDERFPNWELKNEIKTDSDLDLIAESFFPSRFIRDSQTRFFNQAAQDVFKLILERKPTNQEIVRIISSPELIDEIVKGTEIAHKIDPKAGPQRVAVLASLADVGKILRKIPVPRSDKKGFSITGWASGNKRYSWLFFTMSSDTRDSLRPFVSAMMNILMRRLMSIPQAKRHNNEAWWFVADELHTLNSLSALPEFAAECRKHGVRPVLGTQSKHQLVSQYGEEAWGMMAQSKLKVFYRCNEPEAAKWVSQSIGSQERDKTQVSTSLPTTESKGRDSVSFQNVTENKILFIKEQIMSFPDLHGVWKLNNDIVHFKLQYIERRKRHHDFIPRKPEENTPQPISSVNNAPTNITVSTTVENPIVASEEKHQPFNPEPPNGYSNDIRLDF